MKSLMKVIVLLAMALVFLTGCTRESATKDYSDGFKIDKPIVQKLGAVRYADKRGFADVDGDGIQDMNEVNQKGWFNKSYTMNIFFGFKADNGLLQFAKKGETITIPMKLKWFSGDTKTDLADPNGDGLADVIYTQYTEGLRNDKMNIAIALNKGNGKFKFVPANSAIKRRGTGEALGLLLLALIEDHVEDHDVSSEEPLSNYLKMDWADFDGNGSDDLALFWDDDNSLAIEILYTGKNSDRVIIDRMGEFYIEGFMTGRSIVKLDTEDYDGNGLADILVFHGTRGKVTLSLALNLGGRFIPYKDVEIQLPKIDWHSSASKTDTFDANFDGKADYIRITEQDDQAVMIIAPFRGVK